MLIIISLFFLSGVYHGNPTQECWQLNVLLGLPIQDVLDIVLEVTREQEVLLKLILHVSVHLPHLLQVLRSQIQHLLVAVLFLILGSHRRNDVVDVALVLECDVEHHPVVHDEPQMVTDHDLWAHLSPDRKGVAHDGDQHVQEVEDDHNAGGHE